MTSQKFTKLNHTLKIIFKISFQIVELRLFEIVSRPISRSPEKPVPASNRYPVSLFPPRSARHADQRACACSRDRRRDRRRRESLSFSLFPFFLFLFLIFLFLFFFFSSLPLSPSSVSSAARPLYPLFILDNGMNLISKSLTVLTPA